MDTKGWNAILSPFYMAVGEAVEEFSRQTIAEIDVRLLRLEREKLTEKLNDAKRAIERSDDLEKANNFADLSARGLASSTLKESFANGVDTRSAEVLEKMHREFNRAIEKLALLEQKVNARNNRWWSKLLRWLSQS